MTAMQYNSTPLESNCIKNLSTEWQDCFGCGQLQPNEASWWRTAIVLTVSLLSVPTNLLVLVVVHQTPALHNNQCIYMVALAISDLTAGLCFLCTSFRYAITGYGPTTRLELDIGAWLYYLALTTGLLLTVSIGLDKLHQINWPYSYNRIMTTRKVIVTVLGIWAGIAVLSALPTRIVPISGYYYEFTSSTLMFNTKSCRGEDKPDISLLIVRIALFLFLFIVLVAGYGTILVISRRHVRRLRSMQRLSMPMTRPSDADLAEAEAASEKNNKRRRRKRLRGGSMVALQNKWERSKASLRGWITNASILLGFLVCWLPFFIYKIAIAGSNSQTESAQFCIAWFAILYTSLNAVIYGGTYKPFKKGLKSYVSCLRNKQPRHTERQKLMFQRGSSTAAASTAAAATTATTAACE